jgi:hypothetical protein
MRTFFAQCVKIIKENKQFLYFNNMKKEQFLLIIVGIILVAAVILRVVQLFDKQKEGIAVLPPVIVSDNEIETPTIPEEAIATSTPIISEPILTNTTTEVLISQPLSGETVSSPLAVTGQARGNWFFEASLPVKLITFNGDEIVSHYAMAQSDWMTTDFVPFETTLVFTTTATSGYLVISKDNPSGLPENDASFMIPLNF